VYIAQQVATDVRADQRGLLGAVGLLLLLARQHRLRLLQRPSADAARCDGGCVKSVHRPHAGGCLPRRLRPPLQLLALLPAPQHGGVAGPHGRQVAVQLVRAHEGCGGARSHGGAPVQHPWVSPELLHHGAQRRLGQPHVHHALRAVQQLLPHAAQLPVREGVAQQGRGAAGGGQGYAVGRARVASFASER
jgi:hypothetical protein